MFEGTPRTDPEEPEENPCPTLPLETFPGEITAAIPMLPPPFSSLPMLPPPTPPLPATVPETTLPEILVPSASVPETVEIPPLLIVPETDVLIDEFNTPVTSEAFATEAPKVMSAMSVTMLVAKFLMARVIF
jgi:hypothetical protein